MNKFIDLSSSLSTDYEKLYESGRYTDISIQIGTEPNSKIFLAHTVVLCTRSKFIENSLTENKETPEETQKTAITFEDTKPDVFEILLRYIYTGRMSYDSCKSVGWINLLEGLSKFELVDLLAAVETYLIDNENEWIQQNIVTVHKYAASIVSLDKLLAYCNRIMVSHPDIIFKSNDLAALPKETLITLLKWEELNMDEDDIWMSVIQWATKQVSGSKLGNDLDNWSPNDVSAVTDIIADCIPHIRFFSISPPKIALYNDLLPRKLRRDLLNYHMDKEYKPSTQILPPRTGQRYDNSLIISRRQAEWISSKIMESKTRTQGASVKHDVYKFTLLYRQSTDGKAIAKFRELCNNKGPTITVGKVLDTEEILGGYNPFAWGSRIGYAETKESFIFALDKNIDKSIVSFVVDSNSSYAIYDHNDYLPTFGSGYDLFCGHDSHPPYTNPSTYQLPIRNLTGAKNGSFEWDNLEVFLVSKL